MDEAKVVISRKEGIIELESLVDFVRHYLDMFQSTILEKIWGVSFLHVDLSENN